MRTILAISTPIKIAKIFRTPSAFSNMEHYKTSAINYTSNEIYSFIGLDSNYTLFSNYEEAITYVSKISHTSYSNLTISEPQNFISRFFCRPKTINIKQEYSCKPFILALQIIDEKIIKPSPKNHIGNIGIIEKIKLSFISPRSQLTSDSKLFLKNVWTVEENSEQQPKFTENCYHIFPTSYKAMTNKIIECSTEHSNTPKDIVLKILKDYYAPRWGLFLTGHWNRHHTDFARSLHAKIIKTPNNQILDILLKNRSILFDSMKSPMSSSFFRRIEFLTQLLIQNTNSASQTYIQTIAI